MCVFTLLIVHAGNVFEVLGLGGAAQNVQPSIVGVLTLGSEEVDVVLEGELEHVLLLHGVLIAGRTDRISTTCI